MGLYFFHVHRGGILIPDPDGTQMAGFDEACRQAFREARCLLSEHLKTDRPIRLQDGVQLADEHGHVLYTVTFEEALGGEAEQTGGLRRPKRH
jgi:hypothetical protein